MEQIKKFLRSRGFTLALLACLVAAAAAGVWAVRTVRDELKKSYDDLTAPQEEPAPEPQLTLDPQEDDVWQQPVTDAAKSAANVPKPASSASSSGAQSGSGLVHEPSALQGASSPASSSAAPASTQPVSGRVLNAYSGDELVYSSTLGDWRTHNGVDYAASRGAEACRMRSKIKNFLFWNIAAGAVWCASRTAPDTCGGCAALPTPRCRPAMK